MLRTCALLPIAFALALAACTDQSDYDYRQRFPVGVSSHTTPLVVARPEAGAPLPQAIAVALGDVGRDHLRRGAGPVVVSVATAEDKPDAKAAAAAFGQSVAGALNLPESDIQVQVTIGGTEAVGPAVVAAPIWVAEVPSCGDFAWSPTPDWNNTDTANFGCATQRNIGLMVQNPADLVRARQETGRAGERAGDVLDKYGKGSATASEKEAGSTATISGVGTSSQ